MSDRPFPILEADERAAQMLKDFIPEKVFDAHTHIYLSKSIPSFPRETTTFCEEAATPEIYARDMGPFLSGAKTIRLNMMPMLDVAMNDRKAGLRDLGNQHIFEQAKLHPECVGSPYVLMDDTEEEIAAMVEHPGMKGIKCYAYASGFKNLEQCTIGDYLPESAWVVANQKKLPIILHMMRPASLSDPANFDYIQQKTAQYPDAKLVLAHCARSFASWTVVDSIRRLADRENIWFDMAAICESAPMAACILKTAGKRVCWGSDFPVCMHRGRSISLNDGFLWLVDGMLDQLGIQSCLMAAENLLAFRQTCHLLDLDQTQINDLFYNNACRLFDVEP